MEMFGVELDDLIRLKKANGARIDGDDFILDPAALMPPPIEGRLQSVRSKATASFNGSDPDALPR